MPTINIHTRLKSMHRGRTTFPDWLVESYNCQTNKTARRPNDNGNFFFLVKNLKRLPTPLFAPELCDEFSPSIKSPSTTMVRNVTIMWRSFLGGLSHHKVKSVSAITLRNYATMPRLRAE